MNVTGNGGTTPYAVALRLDPSADNAATCTDDGLMVDVSGRPIAVDETDCIAIEGDGSDEDPLSISPIMDETRPNGVRCGANGIWSPPGLDRILPISIDWGAGVGEFLLVDTTTGDCAVTLPLAANSTGGIVTVKKIAAANDLFLTVTGSDFIDGLTTQTLTSQWASATVFSDGTNWYIIGSA